MTFVIASLTAAEDASRTDTGGGFSYKDKIKYGGIEIMTLYEKLDTLTAGEIRGSLEKFTFIYGKKAVEALGLEEIKDFSFWDNGRSVIIYTGTQAVFDCNYDFFHGLKRLTTCYNKSGLFFEFNN